MNSMLEHLIERLRRCNPGQDYPLTAIERQLILEELVRLNEIEECYDSAMSAADDRRWD
jgi:hypothetical protein